MQKHFLILYLLLISLGQVLFAQTGYIFKRIGVTDGLASNYITDMIQDEEGAIWVVSESGLNRLAGKNVTVYNSANSHLKDELTGLLSDDTTRMLWIGTKRDGICCFDYRTQQVVKNYTIHDGLLTNEVVSLSKASDGGIWIVHNRKGIDYYNPKAKLFTSYTTDEVKGLPDGFLCACDDGNGNLYVGHSGGGMSVICLKDKTCLNFRYNANDTASIPGNVVQCIFVDKEKRVWVGTERGLALLSDVKKEFVVFRHREDNPYSLLSNKVADIGQARDGKIWICTMMGGVSILDVQENAFVSPDAIHFQNIRPTNGRDGLSSPNARCFLQDSYGNIWIGNYRGGIDFLSYSRQPFQVLDYTALKDGTLSGKQTWGLAVDETNRIWLGGENEAAVFKEGELVRTILLEGKVRSNTHVSVICRDSEGMLWFGMYRDGILKCNPFTGEIARLDMDEDGLDVCCLYEEKGCMWIGTQSGVFSCRNGKVVKEERINSLLPVPMVHGILRDRNGNLWLGTFGKGVMVLNPEGKLLRCLDTSCGLSSNAVNSLYSDLQGGIWIATRNGVTYIPDVERLDKLEVYADKNGLANLNVRALTADGEGKIWLSTNGGISCWDKSRKRFLNYTYRQGVPQGDFMDGSVCMDKSGLLYFGSQSGVCCFNPLDVEDTRKEVQAKITAIRSYGTLQAQDEKEEIVPFPESELRLPYDRNTFRVTFNVLDYSLSSRAEYAYMMEGLADTWFELSDENQVVFRNLSPGEYTFKVKARLVNQEWGDACSAVRIVVVPPFYLAWYAQIFYIAVVVLVLLAVLRFYKRKLALESRLDLEFHRHENDLKLNSERLRFYTNITHELRTPLTLILGPLEDLSEDKSLLPKHAVKIGIIRDSATRLLNLINQILEFRKTETENRKLKVREEDLVTLVQEVGFKYRELNQNRDVDIRVCTDAEEAVFFYDREIVTIILDNLMSNALKYTSKGEIVLSLKEVEENGTRYTCLSVSDTGHGIDKESLNHIFERYYQGSGKYQASGSGIGLALVKSLADLHEASIEVESEPEKGSCFTLRLQTDNAYPDALHVLPPEEGLEIEAEDWDSPETERGEEKPIVLIVEDNADIREYIQASFVGMYEVLVAADGKSGWKLAKARIPNLIISDIMMPVMDGIELCRLVKEDMRTSHIPVILLTAKDSLQDKEEGYAAGADSFITKPFSARLLKSRINNILENRRKVAGVIAAASTALALVIRNEAEKKEAEAPVMSRLDREFLDKVTAIIQEHLEMTKIDIDFIAEKMCMSHSTLYRKIKGLTNLTANEFVRKLRIKKAVELIDSGEYSIQEVSDLVGFNNIAYFRQCFKDEVGISPSEYMEEKKI